MSKKVAASILAAMRAGCLCFLVACAATRDAEAAEYFVSVQGDDANEGTIVAPFATIQKAADVMKPGDTCYVREGAYRETVQPANSGTAGNPIVFRPYKDETVVVTGADRVTGWTRHEGDIYRAKLDWDLGRNNQVFFDGKMVYEARWPNKQNGDLLVPDAAQIDGGDGGHIVCKALPVNVPDDGWKGAILWCAANPKWSSWTATVQGYDAASKKLAFTNGFSDHHNPRNGGVFYLTGRDAWGQTPYRVSRTSRSVENMG